VTPSSGSGASQNFALQFSDTAGAASLQTLYIYFGATLGSPVNACFLYFSVTTNQIELLQDGGASWVTTTPGAATTLQNSQCSLNAAVTSVVENGNALTLNLPMTFLAAYAGTKNIYMYASDVSGSNNGWQQLGTWTVPTGSGVPAAVSVTPSSGSSANQVFALQYSDTAGAASLQTLYVYFSATLGNPANSCFIYYNTGANQIELLQDSGASWLTSTPGTSTTLQNSQCSLNVANTSVVRNGTTLTLNLAMTFLPAYAGAKNIYMYAADISGANNGWQQLGTWTVPTAAGVAAAVSVSPAAGSFLSQIFALQFSDTAGAASLQTLYVYFSATLGSPVSSCFLYYNVAPNQIELLQDNGVTWLSSTPGVGATLQNSQCSLNLTNTSVVRNGNTLTLNVGMIFLPAYAGAKNIYLYASDVSGSNSGWQQRGTWTVP
jgi:hypothetical protein